MIIPKMGEYTTMQMLTEKIDIGVESYMSILNFPIHRNVLFERINQLHKNLLYFIFNDHIRHRYKLNH